jgi:hypothetical protein
VLCAPITIQIGNSSNTIAPAVLLIGASPLSLQSGYGGKLLVDPALAVPLTLPIGTLNLPTTVICDPTFCGVSIYLQVLEADLGATKGVSFSPGLELVHGG